MLTYTPNPKPRRKDRPWLLIIMVLIWIGGATFFHEPWEPYEPFVVAVVKSMITSNSWLVPYIAKGTPYLDLQPFYFWLYALIIKIFDFSNIVNAVRLINSVIIFAVIVLMGRIGSGLLAFKNGRSVVMILISTIGFINNAYQLAPNLVILLGFALYFAALQQSQERPGISGWMLSVGLIFISLNFTGEFLVIALLMLIVLPFLNREWRNSNYYITTLSGIALFALIFFSYAWQLNNVDHEFFLQWKTRYTAFIVYHPLLWLSGIGFYLQTLLWYIIPSWILVLWTIYKRRKRIFADKILGASVLFIVMLFGFACLSGQQQEAKIFPIIIPFVLLASVEIDSIRISIVSLMNWFCIFTFGLAGLVITALYIALNFGWPADLFGKAQFFAPDYVFQFNAWQLALAVLISGIWLFMITRKQIRGREMVSNWASGSTFVLVLFVSLCLPWFNSVLSFKDMVESSRVYLKSNTTSCVATNGNNNIQNAIWYYYADINLKPEPDFTAGECKQALIGVERNMTINYPGWHVAWSAKRPVDSKRYILLERN